MTKRERERVEEARSSLYEVDQTYLCYRNGRIDPVLLIEKYHNESSSHDCWLVEFMRDGNRTWVPVYELGVQINEMEALAWAAV